MSEGTPLEVQTVAPGALGGSFFWAALTQTGGDRLLAEAFPDGNRLSETGMYRVILNVQGAKQEFLIDDWVPCVGVRDVGTSSGVGAPAYGCVGKPFEVWSMLYGKACAKAAGSFATAFASPLSLSPTGLVVDNTIARLGIAPAGSSEDTLMRPALALAGLLDGVRAPYLPGDTASVVPELAGELAMLAAEIGDTFIPTVTPGLPCFLLTPEVDTAMGIIVTGATSDLVATLQTAQGTTVATLNAENMAPNSVRAVVLLRSEGPYKLALSTVRAVQEGFPELDVAFDFDHEGIAVETTAGPERPQRTGQWALGSGGSGSVDGGITGRRLKGWRDRGAARPRGGAAAAL